MRCNRNTPPRSMTAAATAQAVTVDETARLRVQVVQVIFGEHARVPALPIAPVTFVCVVHVDADEDADADADDDDEDLCGEAITLIRDEGRITSRALRVLRERVSIGAGVVHSLAEDLYVQQLWTIALLRGDAAA